MPDPRFFEDLGPASLRELAELTGASLSDTAQGERLAAAVAPLDRAGAREVGYFADRRYTKDLSRTNAGACFISPNQADKAPPAVVRLITSEPHAAYAKAAARLHRPRAIPPGPPVHPTATLEDDVQIAVGAVVGPGAMIGRGSVVGPGAVIGAGVAIGRQCQIGANAVVLTDIPAGATAVGIPAKVVRIANRSEIETPAEADAGKPGNPTDKI